MRSFFECQLPPVWIRDSYTGNIVSRGTITRLGRDDCWWKWLGWKYDESGHPVLWVISSEHPDGYWQRCATQFGGILWVFPS